MFGAMKSIAPFFLLLIAGGILLYKKVLAANDITLRLKSIKVLIKKMTLTNLPILVVVTVDNTTDESLQIESVTSSLSINSKPFASAINNTPTVIASKGSTDLLLPINVNLLNIGSLIKPLLDAINKGIRPTIETKTAIETKQGTLTIEDKKTVDLVR